jgi:hypothetical protein
VLRSMVRSGPAMASQPTACFNADAEDDAVEDEQVAMSHVQRRRLHAASPSIREELSAIVEDDPEMAVSVLSSWIGQGD